MDAVAEGGAPAQPHAAGRKDSRLDALKQRRRDLAAKKTLTLVVPGSDRELGIIYKAIPRPEIEQFADRVERAKSGEKMATNADLVIRCCKDVVVRQTVDAEWEPLDLDSSEPTTFGSGSEALQEFLEISFEGKTTREEVFALFSPDGAQPLALETHAQALVSWLQGKLEEIDAELLGE